jgi:hypothetical protein
MFNPDHINSKYYYSGEILNVTTIEIELNGKADYISTKFASFTDSTSLVCGDTTGTKFCGNRIPTIWDINLNAEIDLSISTLFKIDYTKNVLII